MKSKLSAIVLILAMLFVAYGILWGCYVPPPTAILVDDPDPVSPEGTVTLDGSDSTGSGGIIKYEWDWEDDGIYDYYETLDYRPDNTFDGITTHIYTNPGTTYTVRLRVTEGYSEHRTATATTTVHVSGTIWHVNDDTPGPTHDGESWETAYTELQDALDDAVAGDHIWVAAGTYYPDEDILPSPRHTNNLRTETFQMLENVKLYGGFAGDEADTMDLDKRNWRVNKTVLSGDIDNNDGETVLLLHLNGVVSTIGGKSPNSVDYSPHCHMDFPDKTVLKPNAEITDGQQKWGGGSLRLYGGSNGGYMRIRDMPSGLDWEILKNETDNWTVDFWIKVDAPITGRQCFMSHGHPNDVSTWSIYYNNGLGFNGGPSGIDLLPAGEISDYDWHHVAFCKVAGKYALYLDGAKVSYTQNPGFYDFYGMYLYTGCMPSEAGDDNKFNGYIDEVRIIKSNRFDADPASSNGISVPTGENPHSYHVVTGADDAVLDGFVITKGCADGSGADESKGAGIYCDNVSPTIENCTIEDNRTGTSGSGGGMYNSSSSSPTVTNCTFSYNSAGKSSTVDYLGGGGMCNYYSSPTVTNCFFIGNSTNGCGGGMCNSSSTVSIENCVFLKNWSNGDEDGQISYKGGYGGGLENLYGSNVQLINCTFTRNSACWDGGAIDNFNAGGMCTITNCIISGNYSLFHPTLSELNGSVDELTVQYSDVNQKSGSVWAGNYNINQSPLFANANDFDGSDNIYGTSDDGLRIMANSPCVDSGTSGGDIPTSDITGRGRINVPYGAGVRLVDMGAYESPTVWFVNDDAAGANNGTSWQNAFKYLQDAMAIAEDGNEIWVAEGTYKPDQNSLITGGSSQQDETFQLIEGVDVYGGFAGQMTGPQTRNWTSFNNTILSGEIGFAGNSDNSSRVVIGTNGALLDGFMITGGLSNGIICVYDLLTVRNCIITNNYNGMAARGGSPVVTNCFFIDNYGDRRAMYNSESSPIVTNCVFSGNAYGAIDSHGGAPTLINCSFYGNGGPSTYGGALRNFQGSKPTVINCIFWGDNGQYSEGQYDYREVYNTGTGTLPTFSYCDIRGCGGSPPSGTWNSNFGNDGGYNIDTVDTDPFADSGDADGPDNIFGTFDDGLKLKTSYVDVADDKVAPVTDILHSNRVDIPDIGSSIADKGAYEYMYARPVHFSGVFMGGEYHTVYWSQTLVEDDYSNIISPPTPPDTYYNTAETIGKALANTLDGIAIQEGTRLIIYSDRDLEGKILLDKTGPAIISNVHRVGYNPDVPFVRGSMIEDWPYHLQNQFPQHVREWSTSGMHAGEERWDEGSFMIIDP